MQVLPDILRYDRTKPATYPNGRVLTSRPTSPTSDCPTPNQAARRSRPGRAGRRPHGAPGPPP